MNDTIAAIATALGIGSISIIRISGEKAITIVNRIFKGADLKEVDSHTIHYGFIMNGAEKIDEVLVTVMRAPKSFTTEDVVEINCHGGIAATNKVLEMLLINGIRLAEPGEFTKRAFLNGRIDLLEAEGIMDLIEAKTEKKRSLALSQMGGKISNLIRDLRKDIVEIISHIEVNIDYPEYEDIEVLKKEDILPKLEKIDQKINHILKESNDASIIEDGILTAIIGRPNVGKSSLLNVLLDEEKAIVTDIPGTTRDIVEGLVPIDGILLKIIDTAGIRNTEDKVESIGVKKSYDFIEKADLILFVLNYNQSLTREDLQILEKIKNKNYIVVINKVDLERRIEVEKLPYEKTVYMSALKKSGVEKIKTKIHEMYHLEKLETQDPTYLTNARSLALLEKAKISLENGRKALENGICVDMAEIDIREAWSILGEITGDTYTNELIDELFSRFCLGK